MFLFYVAVMLRYTVRMICKLSTKSRISFLYSCFYHQIPLRCVPVPNSLPFSGMSYYNWWPGALTTAVLASSADGTDEDACETVMAAAQARAAWQRIANRVFVQDDAKRAPKFASFSPSSLMLLPDSGITGLPKGSYRPASNRNIVSSSLPPETGSCFHPRRNFHSQKVLICENMNAFEKETATSGSLLSGDLDNNAALHADGEKRSGQDEEAIDDLDAVNRDAHHRMTCNGCFEGMESKSAADWLFLQRTEKTALGSEKIEPWWRVAEKGELTLLVMQKSSEHVENCDLPRPLTMLSCGDPLGPLEIFNFGRSCARNPLNDASISSPSGGHTGRSYQASVEAGHPPFHSYRNSWYPSTARTGFLT